MDISRPQRSTAFSSADHSTSALNISLGVEFELLVLEQFPEGDGAFRLPNGPAHVSHGLSLVSSVFKKAIPVGCLSCKETHNITLDSHQQTPDEPLSDHAVWNIVTDDTVKLDSNDQLHIWKNKCSSYAAEVTSRVFYADQKILQGAKRETRQSHVHNYTYQEEIAGVLNALHRSFDTGRGKELTINKTCAFHVHIGNGSFGFPLQTVKNVLCIYVAFERLIDGMHTTTRIGGSALAICALNSREIPPGDDVVGQYPAAHDIYNKPLTDHLISSAYVIRRNDKRHQEDKLKMNRYPTTGMEGNPALVKAASGFDTKSFIEVIQQAPNLGALQQLFARTATIDKEVEKKKTDINILNLSEPADTNRTNTIEFRQHAGVMTFEEILPWIDFVQALVRYAHSETAEGVRDVCAIAANDPDFKLKGLFELLNVSQETQSYYLNRTANITDDAVPAKSKQATVNDPIQSLVQKLAAQRKAESDPEAVAKAVRTKFRLGGYGQYSREFVDGYVKSWSEEEKTGLNLESLAIGYQEPDEPEPEPFEDEVPDEEGDSAIGHFE